jgi:site-specific DNA-methyltransferase (adenine-specific)
MNRIIHGDNLPVLRTTPSESANLIYIDPPFNTGKTQVRHRISTVRDDSGDRTGFGGRRYRTIKIGSTGYVDFFSDYLDFLSPRLVEAHRVLTNDGSLSSTSAIAKFITARSCLIIYSGDIAFRMRSSGLTTMALVRNQKWPAKRDSILWYSKDPKHFVSIRLFFGLDSELTERRIDMRSPAPES